MPQGQVTFSPGFLRDHAVWLALRPALLEEVGLKINTVPRPSQTTVDRFVEVASDPECEFVTPDTKAPCPQFCRKGFGDFLFAFTGMHDKHMVRTLV